MMGKKIFWASVLGLFAFGLTVKGGLPAKKLVFGTSVRANAVFELPPLAAEEQGFWKKNAVDVEWVPFSSGSSMFRGVAAGVLHMGQGSGPSSVQAAARGIPIVMVGDLGIKYDSFFWVLKDSHIKTPKDLKGARIGTVRFGGLSDAYGRVVVRALGLEKDVKFVATADTRADMAALRTGVTDVRVGTFISTAPLKVQGIAREILSVRDYLPKEWVEIVIFALKSFSETSPEAVQGVIRALLQSTDFIMKNRPWAIEKMKSNFRYSDITAEVIYDTLIFGKDAKINRKAVENIRSFLIDYGIIEKEKAPSVDGLFTNRFNG